MLALRRCSIVILFLVLGLSVNGWAQQSITASRLKIAVTIFPLYDLARQVAGSEVEIVLLIPPGTSPHTVAFTPSMIRALTGSVAIFAIGHGLDDWAIRLAGDAGVARTFLVDDRVTLRAGHGYEHAHDHKHAHDKHAHDAQPRKKRNVDPHYWLAIANAIEIVQSLATALGQLDTENQAAYGQRAAAYIQELQTADNAIRQTLAQVTRHDIALFHSAFDYFAAAYGLDIIATFEPTPGQEPGPRHVLDFLRRVRDHKLQVLFIEPQLRDSALRSLAQDLNMSLKELDPLGGTEGRDSYIALMQFNASQIASVLRE